MKNSIYELFGWYGTAAILLAYALVSFGMGGVRADSAIYQALNFTGAVGIAIISLKKKAYQPATLNAVWAIIGLIALLKIIF